MDSIKPLKVPQMFWGVLSALNSIAVEHSHAIVKDLAFPSRFLLCANGYLSWN